jgi:hypothetical protein
VVIGHSKIVLSCRCALFFFSRIYKKISHEFPCDTSDMMRGNCSKISMPASWSASQLLAVDVFSPTYDRRRNQCSEFPHLETPGGLIGRGSLQDLLLANLLLLAVIAAWALDIITDMVRELLF